MSDPVHPSFDDHVEFAVARLLPNGTLDSGFEGDGLLTFPIGSGNSDDSVSSVVIDGTVAYTAGVVAGKRTFDDRGRRWLSAHARFPVYTRGGVSTVWH